MRQIAGVVMMLDGAMQALGVAGVVSTIADRSWRDRGLFVAHLVVGAALIFTGRHLFANPTNLTNPANLTNRSSWFLVLALALSVFEATWFNWTDAAIRAVYTVVLLVVLRRTTLPTT
jgi:hypothetical protein